MLLRLLSQSTPTSKVSTGNLLMNEGGSPSRGGPSPSWGGPGAPSRGFFSLCITIYRRKNHNCKKRQWCLWRYMYRCPLSMHQFIEISICALENKKIHTFRCRAIRESLCANGSSRAPPPKLSGKLSSQAPFEKKTNSGGFHMKHQPCPSCTNVQLNKNILQTYLDIMWLFRNRYPFQWRNSSSSIWV